MIGVVAVARCHEVAEGLDDLELDAPPPQRRPLLLLHVAHAVVLVAVLHPSCLLGVSCVCARARWLLRLERPSACFACRRDAGAGSIYRRRVLQYMGMLLHISSVVGTMDSTAMMGVMVCTYLLLLLLFKKKKSVGNKMTID